MLLNFLFEYFVARWALFSYKWGYKWVTEAITLLIGVITPFTTGRGPPCRIVDIILTNRLTSFIHFDKKF